MSHTHDGHMFGSTDHADSAGQPWEGRQFEANPFADDNGEISEELAAALNTFRSLGVDDLLRAEALISVIDAIRSTRFLIPLLAEAGEVGVNAAGLVVDKTQELAIVTVEGPQGQRVLPVFTSVAALQRWNPQARPVPVEARRAALAAAADGAQWIVIDPQSPTELILRRPVIAAIAQDLSWQPAHADVEVQQAFNRSLEAQDIVKSITLLAGDPDARGMSEDLIVQIGLPPQMSAEQIQDVVSLLSTRWAQDETIALRVDSMKLQLTTVH